MDDENELENQSIDIPIWKRYLLSVTEAAQFYHIGEKRLRQIVDIHPNGEFYLLVGNKVLFKKEQFDEPTLKIREVAEKYGIKKD